jgi:hypothetical protein
VLFVETTYSCDRPLFCDVVNLGIACLRAEMLLGERELAITGLQRVTQAECSGERSATYGHH